ncbi:MAG: alkaline phosphatase family protein, partial [Rubrobacter sp.]|nr:alkaline phosphatase family protein [Rubrobacter sp.]
DACELQLSLVVLDATHTPDPTSSPRSARPVILLVLDGVRPDVLKSAIEEGAAPTLGALAQKGEAAWDAVSVFPSITPAATAAIATGEPPAGSGIVGHSWYDREADLPVIYGAMRETVISSGPLKVLDNNVWRMNRDHLSAPTIFERLHEQGIEGSCVNFPIRRGPYTHPVRLKSVERVSKAGDYLGESVDGPREYYMGDLFHSRRSESNGREGTGGIMQSAGINDEHAADVGARLLREGAAPFNLLYFFKGDSITHHKGIGAQRRWIERADGYVARAFEAAGGVERVLEDYAVLALSDHGHSPLIDDAKQSRHADLNSALPEATLISPRSRLRGKDDILILPNGRAAFIYLGDRRKPEPLAERLISERGLGLAAWRENGGVRVRSQGAELYFRRVRGADGAVDASGGLWEIDGDLGALDMSLSGKEIEYGEYPDALNRLWGGLGSARTGELVLSAKPGYTFGEISGSYHKASDHGSLHASDSNIFALASGVSAPRRITDVAPILLAHFAGASAGAAGANARLIGS